MHPVVKKMEAQLARWNEKIEQRAVRCLQKGGPVSFEALMHVDELKALHAIATAKLGELRAAGNADRKRIEAEMRSAGNDVAAALKRTMPPP